MAKRGEKKKRKNRRVSTPKVEDEENALRDEIGRLRVHTEGLRSGRTGTPGYSERHQRGTERARGHLGDWQAKEKQYDYDPLEDFIQRTEGGRKRPGYSTGGSVTARGQGKASRVRPTRLT